MDFFILNCVSFVSFCLFKSKYCVIVFFKKLFDNVFCGYIKYIFLWWFYFENVYEVKFEGFGFL